MKAALYVRVSTTYQSTDNQLPVLETWAKQRGFKEVATYSENESAWRNGHQAVAYMTPLKFLELQQQNLKR
ncbi:recombinase family protein [Chloroflexota bacterium]